MRLGWKKNNEKFRINLVLISLKQSRESKKCCLTCNKPMTSQTNDTVVEKKEREEEGRRKKILLRINSECSKNLFTV